MDIVSRVKNICLTPLTEWPVIAGESTPPATLITGYVVPLVGISALAAFIGGSLIGRTLPFIGTYRVPIVTGLGLLVFTVVMGIVGVYVLSLIIDALAPTFGAEKNSAQAMKVAVYSFTPAWVAGVFQILPLLGVLALLGSLYGIYLMYLGLPRLMKSPDDKAVAYTAVVVVCAIVISLIISSIGLAIGGVAGAGLIGGGANSAPAASTVEFDKDSPLGKLQQLGKGLEQSADKMKAAEKSGDQAAQTAAALEGLGTLFGGGKRVDPVAIDALKPFVPDTFAGMPRRSSSAERSGLGTVMVSKAQATYGDGAQREIALDVTDTGGASGLMGLASWMGMQQERETDDGFERTSKVEGRLIHEQVSRSAGTSEYSMVLGDRFMVNAKGRGVGLDEVKAAVAGLNLAGLEAMKDVGVLK